MGQSSSSHDDNSRAGKVSGSDRLGRTWAIAADLRRGGRKGVSRPLGGRIPIAPHAGAICVPLKGFSSPCAAFCHTAGTGLAGTRQIHGGSPLEMAESRPNQASSSGNSKAVPMPSRLIARAAKAPHSSPSCKAWAVPMAWALMP